VKHREGEGEDEIFASAGTQTEDLKAITSVFPFCSVETNRSSILFRAQRQVVISAICYLTRI
jgi:hypothetical protein